MRTSLLHIIRLFFLLLAGFTAVQAQDLSNRGREFWLGYGFNYSFFHEPPINNQDLQLYISAQQATTVTITINGTAYSQTLNIPANTVDFSVIIPKSGANDARITDEGLFNRGIRIVSTEPVAVYAHQYNVQVSGATMLMPVETYGYSYYSVNYSQTSSNSNPPSWYSWFFVIASEDNTRIQITPSDTTKNGWLPGQTYTVNLNKGQIYNVMGKGVFGTSAALASKDMTGSKIVSVPGADGKCHPVGVFSGSGGIRLCPGDGGEYMGQQMFPARAWGTRYLTYHLTNTTTGNFFAPFLNYYRVCVLDPTTVVRRNGVPLTGLIRNFYYEFSSTTGDYIESDKPILVSQYTPNANQCVGTSTFSYGDPEMVYLSPIEQGQNDVLFYKSRRSSIDFVHTNIYLPTAAVGSLRVDGAALPAANIIPHPANPAYSVAVARHTGPASSHRITCDSNFNATVYGIGLFESYGYNVGTRINNLNNFSSIANTLNSTGLVDTFTCPKTPVRLFAKLAFPASSITWQLSAVSGVTPNADVVINNPVPVRTERINNRDYYVYSLNQDFVFSSPGTYTIPITYSAAVIENCNQTDFAEIRVLVKPGPVADFRVAGQGCAVDTLFFEGTSDKKNFNIVGYLWNFEDNTTQTTENAAKKFSNTNPQQVKYTIRADNGCIHDTTKTVLPNSQPLAKFGLPASYCAGDSIRVTDSSVINSGSIVNWRWDFGDGRVVNASNGNPLSHRYAATGTYTIRLVVTSAEGCVSDTAAQTVTITNRPQARFGTGTAPCLGEALRFSDSSTITNGTLTRWSWNFGDGNTATYTNGNPFDYTYATAGSYTVQLVVQSGTACTDTFTRSITIQPRPAAAFSSNPTVCQGSALTFTDNSTIASGSITSWNWIFGDGNSSNRTSGAPFTHTYTSPGSFTAALVVRSGNGCNSDTVKQSITVFPRPVANFGFDQSSCRNPGEPVRISDSSAIASGSITSWNWNFGDGNSASYTNGNPFDYLFQGTGSYPVKLVTVSNNNCASDTTTKTLVVSVKPVAGFNLSKNEACAGDTIRFTDNSTIAGGSITTWNWDFGNGQTSIRNNNSPFIFAFNTPGTFTITLRVTSAGNCDSDPVTATVTIHEQPQASFITGGTVCTGDSVLFTGSATPGTGSITGWNWNFGNGTTLVRTTAQPFYYTYPAAGNYSASLSVTSDKGCASPAFTVPVQVTARPSAAFTVSGKPCADSLYTFVSATPANNNPAATWYWAFGDGQTATSGNSNTISHPYAVRAGGYTVTHVVQYSPSCVSDTVRFTLPAIRPNPVASFSIAGDTLCVDKPLLLQAASSAPAAQWNWDLGNRTSNQAPPFTIQYAAGGNYTIRLTVTDSAGCGSVPVNNAVAIRPAPVLNAGPDKYINPGGSVVLDATCSNAGDYDFRWTPATGLSNSTTLTPTASPDTSTRYVVQAVHRTALCTATDDVVVFVISKLFVPNAFTPNGDGVNDLWRIPGLELYPDAELVLFNRWGQQVLRSRNYNRNPWNGTLGGKEVAPGLFTYIIFLNNDQKEVMRGTVTLIR
ncbi:MAG TPA: PKD domain-containing protein [Lacibacter sp.]|nr:PKD domain-containing protein [Lacibacter sp.]